MASPLSIEHINRSIENMPVIMILGHSINNFTMLMNHLDSESEGTTENDSYCRQSKMGLSFNNRK